MKKTIIILIFQFIATISSFAQDSLSLWPISGQKAGENILYKPTDYIGTEKNFDDLFITAPEGTPVLAPVSGTISSIGYHYSGSLVTISSFDVSTAPITDIAEYDKQQRRLIADRESLNAQFISISICISYRPGEHYWIRGLRPFVMFKTGHKIKKGDIIGYVGYCYKLIPEPCVWFNRSINGKPADPMSPFGLKTSFIPYKPVPIKSEIPVSELISDFKVFRQALEEGHPGLYDYTLRANMDSIFESIRRKITLPMSSPKFYGLLRPVIDSIRDSHTALYNTSGQADIYPQKEIIELPVQFGFQNDSLIIFRTLPDYKNLLHKRILKINNESAKSILQNTKIFSGVQEGYINEQSNYNRLRLFFMYYRIRYNHKKGDSVTLAFSGGTQARLSYQAIKDPNEFLPKREKKGNDTENNFEVKNIDSNTTYIRIKTFELTNTDEDSLRAVIRSLNNLLCRNLIIDIRDNLGGNNSYSNLFAMLAEQPFRTCCASMVKSNGRYTFLKNTESYVDTVVLFPNYRKIVGKEGFYEKYTELDKPNDSIHFGGKVYVLANENSKSAATLFAALMHKYKRGVVIGRETGTCYYQMNALKFVTVRLNNSILELYMPLVKEIFEDQIDKSIPLGHGVIPDHYIGWTYDEFFNNRDTILNYALNLIRESGITK